MAPPINAGGIPPIIGSSPDAGPAAVNQASGPSGGHMSHHTTTAVRQMTAYSTTTAGGLSVSNQAGLKASFPGSPLFVEGDEGYDALAVKKYLYKILTNTIHGLDIPAAAAYWGFPYGGLSDEAHPSTADLAYSGAPAIDAQTAVGADFASPYMPNLLVPPIEAPTSPVEQQVVLSKASNPPYVGNGLASPLKTQATIKSHLVTSQKDGNTPINGGAGTAVGGYTGGEEFHLPKE